MNCAYNSYLSAGVLLAAASLSLIACLLALGALLFFNMYRNFFYRLLLYTFVTLIFLSSIWILQPIIHLLDHEKHMESITQNNCSTKQNISSNILSYTVYSSLCTIYLLLTSLNFCLYLLSIHHYQFSSWVADLIFLVTCLLLPQPLTLTPTIACGGITLSWKSHDCPTFVLLIAAATIVLLTNIILTTLALLPVCCRACGYNRCVRSAATRSRESYQRALKEILPLFIFLSYTCFAIISLVLAAVKCKLIDAFLRLLGLFLALSFATHLCILGKAKLKKLRGRNRSLATHKSYGSMVIQQHTHRTTVFTSEGISETCNTDYPHVSEDEVDKKLYLS